MKAIIIAGGSGLRLRPLTKSIPKCLLRVGNKLILDWILDALKTANIDDIVLTTGFKEKIIEKQYSYLKFYSDAHYRKSSILRGLFCAQREMSEGFIASYSDIIYKSSIVKKLVHNQNDFSLIIDKNWRKIYKDRSLHSESEAEKVIVQNQKIVRIGKKINLEESTGEFIGLAKFSKKGAQIAVRIYNQLTKKYRGKPFHKARDFERAYLTDFFQELIDRGYKISPVFIQGGWLEIDTPEDLNKARAIFF